MTQKNNTKNTRYQMYLNEDIKKTISEQFKTKISDDNNKTIINTIKEKLGEPHPFDYSIVEGLEKKFGLVGAIEDKVCDYTLGPGIFIESKDEKIKDFLEKWIKKVSLEYHLRPWFKAALGKGSGYMEIAGLSDNTKFEMVKVVNTNSIYVKRDKYGNVESYQQYFGDTKLSRIDESKIINLKKDEIIQLNINVIGNYAYGYGIVYSAINIIDNFLGAIKSSHQIMKRKANNPIHAKLGNAEKDDYPEQDDINSFGKNLQFMNDMTEWVTGPNVEMKVLDFGNISEKFKDIMEMDLKLISYAFQVPESILGADKGYVGAAEIQDRGFDKNIREYQKQLSYVLSKKIFEPLLIKNGFKNIDFDVIWGLQSQEEKNALRLSYQQILSSNIQLSPGMRLAYEKKLALLDNINFDDVEKENEKIMRRENRDKKKTFNNEVELQKQKFQQKQQESFEHEINHVVKEELLKGRAPQEVETLLITDYELKEDEAFKLVENINDELEKDYQLEEWIGEYTPVKNDIIDFIESDEFKHLLATNKKEIAMGMLTASQIDKLKNILKTSYVEGLTLQQISNKIKKIKLKDRYILKDNKFVLAVSKDKRPNMIARSETVRTKAEGVLIANEKKGKIDAVFETVSTNPCEQCDALNNLVYDIEDAKGMLPLHSNCRCRWRIE